MYDDPLDLPRALGRSAWEMLTTAGQYSYYRPLTFLIWAAMHGILGRFDPFWYYLAPVAVNALNAALVIFLLLPVAGRLRAVAAGVLFATFPFTYQIVDGAVALGHTLVVCFVLATLLLYRGFQTTRRPVLAVASVLTAALGFLSHENGVTVAPLMLWYELVWRPGDVPRSRERGDTSLLSGPAARRWLLPALHVALAGCYLAVYRAIPKVHAPFSLDPASVRLNGLYLLQGVLYWPVALAQRDAPGWIVAAGGAALLLALLLHAAHGTRRLALFALGWSALAWLPTLVALPFAYVIDAPRLLYLPSVGIAAFWTGTLARPRRRPASIAASCAAALAVACACWLSVGFLQREQTLYRIGSDVMHRMAEAAASSPRGVAFVNPVSWLAPKRAEFPLGHTGVTLVPTYVGLDQAERIAVNRDVDVAWTGYSVLKQPWRYDYLELGGNASPEDLDRMLRSHGAVYVTRFGEGLTLDYAGGLQPGPAGGPATGAAAIFGGRIALLGASATPLGRDVALALRWRALSPSPQDVTVFAHLDGPDGKPVAQADGYPVLGTSAIRLWRAGDLVDDRRTITVPPDLPLAAYTVRVGVYGRDDGKRLHAATASGAPLRDDAVDVATLDMGRAGNPVAGTRPNG